jgi:hypothetical protein
MTTAQAQARDGLLNDSKSIQLTLAADHDPSEFYQTRSGLFVWDDFRHLIVSGAKPTKSGTSFSVTSARLTREATDAEIERALLAEHLFDESAACAIIAELIAKQPGGGEGHLQNTGYANLLYTRSCVVGVYWDGLYREWRVYSWGRDVLGWDAGRRVLSPGN